MADTLDKLATAAANTLDDLHEPAVVANMYLHPLNAHPNALARYAALAAGKPAHGERLKSAAAGLAIELNALTRPMDLFNGDELPARADILFVSHFLRSSQAHDLSDLYFGTLAQWLDQRGISSVTALINHSRQPWQHLSDQWVSSASSRVLLSRWTDWATEREIGRQLAGAAAQLGRRGSQQATGFDRDFLAHAAAEAASSGSRTALRIGRQIRELVRRLKPRMLVTTYEGHSWERLAFQAARLENPDIVCVGYHHALLFPFTRAMTHRLGASYDPDHILTAGDNTTQWLGMQSGVRQIPTTTMGSVRATPATRSPDKAESNRICLVIPEGTALEASKLAELAIRTAQQCPNVTFRIRLHPVLSLERLLRQYRALRTLPANVTWSNASLDEDIESSRWALYRGTTAVIAAILAGLKPIYYHDGGIVIDPLSAMPAWRDTVRDAAELARSIQFDLARDAGARRADFELAEIFCRKCFAPFNPQALTSLLKAEISR
ncbi:MAG: hypothetical protein ACOH2M_16945 [Cypionkella sp.]